MQTNGHCNTRIPCTARRRVAPKPDGLASRVSVQGRHRHPKHPLVGVRIVDVDEDVGIRHVHVERVRCVSPDDDPGALRRIGVTQLPEQR